MQIQDIQKKLEEVSELLLQEERALEEVRHAVSEGRALVKELAEVQVGVEQRRAFLLMLENLLSSLSGNSVVVETLNSRDSRLRDSHKPSHRHPKDMLRSEYKGMQLGEIIETVLTKHKRPLTTSEISQEIYVVNDEQEFSRARNSLSSELRLGVKREKPRWCKVGRYAYAALPELSETGSFVQEAQRR